MAFERCFFPVIQSACHCQPSQLQTFGLHIYVTIILLNRYSVLEATCTIITRSSPRHSLKFIFHDYNTLFFQNMEALFV